MLERPQGGERAVLVHVEFPDEADRENLQEIEELAVSAGARPVAIITAARKSPDARLFIGSGKAEEVRQAILEQDAELVLFNHALSPGQERNLERVLECRVLDRTGLILDIFAQRARSHEGKLQVELAQLRHLSTRLVRGWTHLERQKGGIGLRGPGETQLETDRRLLGERIRQLQKRLEKVDRQREQGRRARQRAELPTVALVGYTNAGKSTLFNHLTTAGVYAADQLFATLDPTLRKLTLPDGRAVVLADTVGFIRHLPHELVAAFRSTLQETRDADLLLHVIDSQDAERTEKTAQVHQVLAEIGAAEVPIIEVYNKIDLADDGQPQIIMDGEEMPRRVHLSAVSGAGLDLLQQAIIRFFHTETLCSQLSLPPTAGRLRAALYSLDAVQEETVAEDGSWQLDVEIRARDLAALRKQQEFAVLLPLS